MKIPNPTPFRTALLSAIALVAIVGLTPSSHAGDIGYRAWGLRAGLSDSPDQVVGGVHFDMGEFAPHVRWQPSLEVGSGDDITSLAGNFTVVYDFQTASSLRPYAGGEVSAVYYDADRGGSDTEIGPGVVGGFETRLSGGTRFLLELHLGFGDVPDAKLMAGWTF